MIYELILLITVILILLFIYLIKNVKKGSNQELLTCFNSRWGCCNDNYTPKLDIFGSNCRGF
jgi:hypothetical protein